MSVCLYQKEVPLLCNAKYSKLQDVLTFVRWKTVAVRNFGPDVVLQPFQTVLELLG
jgi:hypothetical protein